MSEFREMSRKQIALVAAAAVVVIAILVGIAWCSGGGPEATLLPHLLPR